MKQTYVQEYRWTLKQYTEEKKFDRIKKHILRDSVTYARPKLGNHALSERSGFQGLRGGRKRGITANRLVVSYWSGENVLEVDRW